MLQTGRGKYNHTRSNGCVSVTENKINRWRATVPWPLLIQNIFGDRSAWTLGWLYPSTFLDIVVIATARATGAVNRKGHEKRRRRSAGHALLVLFSRISRNSVFETARHGTLPPTCYRPGLTELFSRKRKWHLTDRRTTKLRATSALTSI